MRKLMFVTALVASVAAIGGEPINAISFEGYPTNQTINIGSYELDEEGNSKSEYFFSFEGSDSDTNVVDGSTIQAYDSTPTFASRPKYFADNSIATAKYLKLETSGGTLWRSLVQPEDVSETSANILGEAQPVGEGIYLDTLVQFTAWEDDAPAVTNDTDKLAIWLSVTNVTNEGVEKPVTNLMVRAGYYDSEYAFDKKSFILGNSDIEIKAGEWYRLTIKTIDNVFTENDEVKISAFAIYVNGILMKAVESTMATNSINMFSNNYLSFDMGKKLEEGSLFLSLVLGTSGEASTLQAVGFQGTGAVDDIVWTNEDPISQTPSVVEYTLTLTDGGNVTWGAVTYTIGGNEVSVNSGSKIPEDAVVSIASPTFASDYELDALTTNTVAVVGPTFPFTFTMTGDMTVAISAKKTETPVENPTVDGQTVEPANVFNTAASDKPITYPSAPTIAGKEGSQTIAFNGVTVSVPDYYTATLDGNVVSLALNTNALPVIADATIEGTVKNAIEVGATTFTTTLTSTNEKLYYGLKVATSPNAPDEDWTVSALTKGTGAAMQIQMDKPTVSENPASAGFFKVYVTDIAPAAGE